MTKRNLEFTVFTCRIKMLKGKVRHFLMLFKRKKDIVFIIGVAVVQELEQVMSAQVELNNAA